MKATRHAKILEIIDIHDIEKKLIEEQRAQNKKAGEPKKEAPQNANGIRM